jgi:FixJ family two-component response regulator
MEVGAIGFLEKPCGMDVLRESIQKAIALAQKLHDEAAQDIAIRERLAQLTPEERVTMQWIAAGKPDKAIASRLDISVRTVQLRRASLMKKLRVTTRAELIRIAPRDTQVLAFTDCP